jgi:hypothetical protein
MMQKLAASERLDMFFDLSQDPYELSNLLGNNGMTAANATIIQAEHMRCLLLDWMTRLDGSVGYYSDPAANYGQGNGDISEIRERQSWKTIGFWTSASDTGVLELGKVAWNSDAYVRHEWLYMGTRISGQSIRVTSMSITGQHAGLVTIDETVPIEFAYQDCVAIRVTFSSSSSLSSTPIDATLSIQWSVLDSSGAASSPTTDIIQLAMADYDFESQNLGYPPAPTLAPTISPAPTNPPTNRPTDPPVNDPTTDPTAPTAGATPTPTAAVSTAATDVDSDATTTAPSQSSNGSANAPTTNNVDNVTFTLPPAAECGSECNETPAASACGRSLGGITLAIAALAMMML